MHKKAYWQYVRGICILAVVLIHAINGFSYTGFSETPIVLRKTINFAVATFVFMSGYFVNTEKIASKAFDYIRWMKSRGGRLLIPYTVWSTFYCGVSLVLDLAGQRKIEPLFIIYKFMTGTAAAPFYYVIVLFQLAAITPWLIDVVKNKPKIRTALWLMTPTYLIYVYLYNFAVGMEPPLYGTLFPAWFGFYYLGIQIKCERCKKLIALFGNRTAVVSALAISCVEAYILQGFGMRFATSQITIGSFLYSTAATCYIVANSMKIRKIDWLAKIGDCSYGIFYIHMFVLMVIEKIGSITGMESRWLSYGLLLFALTAVISYLIVRSCQVIAGKIKCDKLLQWAGFV